MGLRGRPPKYTAEEFATVVDSYFDECERDGTFPDEAGMWLFLGCTDKIARRNMSQEKERGEDERPFTAVLDNAKKRRESWLTRRMVTDNKTAQGCMNALKQEKNGGYIDRPPIQADVKKLVVNMIGVGKDAGK